MPGTDPWDPAPLPIGASLTSVTVDGEGFGGIGATITSQPYPVGATLTSNPVGPIASLQQYSIQGYRLAKLQTRPPWIREVYGYKEHFSRDDQSSVRVFDVPCSGRKAAIDWWLGYSQLSLDGLSIQRILPEQHPKYPWMWATSADLIEPKEMAIINDPYSVVLDPAGGPNPIQIPMIFYAEKQPGMGPNGRDLFLDAPMRYAVTYRPLRWELLTDAEAAASGVGELSRWVDRDISYAVQAQPIPNGLPFKFVEGPYAGQAIIGNPQFILPTKQLIWRWIDIPDLPNLAINNCIGCVNNAPFDGAVGWDLYDTGTLLLHAPKPTRKKSTVGKITWDVEMRMDWRPNGWNRFIAIDRNWYGATLNGVAGEFLYRLANFNALFQTNAVFTANYVPGASGNF